MSAKSRSAPKALLRRFVVVTSVGPLLQAYLLAYRLLIRYVSWWFRRRPGAIAVYLVRGATSRIVPGISDIDLRAVGEWTPDQRDRIAREYRSLRKWVPVYDPTVPMKLENPAMVRRQYEIDAFDRYGLWEGKHRWKLLWGSDVISELPDLSPQRRQSAIFSYTRWWWMVFVHTVFDAGHAAEDPMFTRSICAKAVAEILRMEHLRQGWQPVSRDQALSIEAERSEAGSYLRRLSDYVGSGYRSFDGDMLRETAEFLPRCVAGLCSRMSGDPATYISPRISIEVDHPAHEEFHTDKEAAVVQQLKDYIRGHWNCCSNIDQAVGVAFVMDEILIVISVSALPDYGQVLEFNEFRESLCHGLVREIHCYLRIDVTLLQLHAADRGRSWQAILTDAANPETVLPLPGRHERAELGWSQALEDFLLLETTLFDEALDTPAVYKANALDFLRMFWKYLQMVIVARTAAEGSALFPQTVAGVRRALRRIGAPEIPFVGELERAYFALLDGQPFDLGWMQPAAVDYLKEVRSGR